MMKKALSVALCLLMAGTVLTACSNPDEFSDSENLSLKYTRSDKTDDTFNYADGAKTAPSSYDTYSAKIPILNSGFSETVTKAVRMYFVPQMRFLILRLWLTVRRAILRKKSPMHFAAV